SSLAKSKEGNAPHLIYFSERVFNLETFFSDVEVTYAKWGRAVIVVSEGLKDDTGAYLGGIKSEASRDGFGRTLPGGAASFLAEQISEKLKLRARNEKPGLAARSSVHYASLVDQKEAYMVGKMAVRFAAKRETGVMMTLEREKGRTYRCHVGTAPLKNIAMSEKLLPENFINAKGNFVTDAFLRYCQPIIGGPIQSFPALKGYALSHR
ncbi:MAG: 6-phosphofructokinase, partial [Bacteroidota bacterium]|nr:6-phosphofructokinase [Bacteroidota bacterium]